MRKRFRNFNLGGTFTLCFLLSACGGGGGGGSTSPPAPPPPPKTLSGIVMLGPVSGADVQIVGSSGTLGSGVTAADGSFGPIEYSGSYNGPMRVTVTGNASSQWTCDFRLGCAFDGTINLYGSSLPYDAELEAVLPGAVDGDFVSVSLLSNFVTERMDALGGLSAANVNQADADIRQAINLAIGTELDTFANGLPQNLSAIELFDVQNPPAPGGVNDAVSLLLSLFNSALIGLSNGTDSTDEFINSISGAIATAAPLIPISNPSPTFGGASQEAFLSVFFTQVAETFFSGDPVGLAMNELLAPRSLNELADSTIDSFLSAPRLLLGSGFAESVFVNDSRVGVPQILILDVRTNTGAQLGINDFDVATFSPPDVTSPWLTATRRLVGGQPAVEVEIDTNQLATLPNGEYQVFVGVYSTSGEYFRATTRLDVQLQLVGMQVEAGANVVANERDVVTLSGSTSSPNDVATIAWSQLSGPDAVITNGDTFTPMVELPSLDQSANAIFELRVEFTTGEVRTDRVEITVNPYPNIADLTFDDATLAQCVSDAAALGNLIETPELTTLTCAGVTDVTGLDVFPNLTTLNLAGNALTSLQPLLALDSLEFLDLSGNSSLRCGEIDELASRLEEGVSLLVDDICLASDRLDLGASGFETVFDAVRNQLYVSLPERNELAVVSLDQRRIVDRLLLPGTPNGIDLSIDGTRVFAALNGSNAVAVVDIEQRSVTTIDLGNVSGDAKTYDVVEGAPDRLFVSTNGSSGAFSYIAQVQLDQGNLVTRAANDRIIRARPVLARAPDEQFVYVGAGFSPNSLYKLSMLDPDAPIILEDDHGSVGGTDNLALNSTGTRIALGSGQVLRTASFIEEGRVSPGPSTASNVTNTLFVAGANGLIEAFDFDTLTQTGSITTQCNASQTSQIDALSDDNSFALLQSSDLCIYGSRSRSVPPDPFSALRFPDLALEECVIDAAMAAGYTQPEEFTALDCSTAPRSILGLDGIERLSNLQTLNLSNSGVSDLQPLASLPALQSLSVANATVSDIAPLFNIALLDTVNLSGNARVLCTALNDLVATGVAVTADQCTDAVRIELAGIGHDMEFDATGNRVFVSIPSLNRVAEIDLDEGIVTDNFSLPAQPRGIDLADDGTTIYAALNTIGSLGVVDSTTGSVEAIDLRVELDNDGTWDVAEVSTDRVVVSTNEGSGGFGYIVEVRRDLGNAATRVASNAIIRARPNFAVSQDRTAVYVGEGFSPNSLYKLDATQTDLPLVLEDDHGSVNGTDQLALSPDGTRIYLRSGQVFDTSTFSQVGLFPQGRPLVSQDGTRLLVGDAAADTARVYDLTSTAQVDARPWECDINAISAMFEFGDGILVLGDDLVCYSRTVTYP